MIFKTFELNVDYAKAGCEPSTQRPHLDCYVPEVAWEPQKQENRKRPGFIVIPGGGYGVVCGDREGEPIALRFAAMGIPSFVVWYSIAPARYPAALLEACEAVAIVRAHAGEWCVDPDNIHVGGFSAGGHLAGSVGTLWNKPLICDTLGYYHEEHRPNGLMLGYPVLSAEGTACHMGSYLNLLGHEPDESERELLSCERQIGEHTPRTFLWHTYDDAVVPVKNSLLFASALEEHHIPFELHIYPKGPHGLALGNRVTGLEEPDVVDWVERAAQWMRNK